MAAKKPQKIEIVAQDGPTEETVLERTEKMVGQAGKLLSQMQASTRFNSAMRADGTCPIFYQDVVQHIALPGLTLNFHKCSFWPAVRQRTMCSWASFLILYQVSKAKH
jgi:hypothetical protein